MFMRSCGPLTKLSAPLLLDHWTSYAWKARAWDWPDLSISRGSMEDHFKLPYSGYIVNKMVFLDDGNLN